MNGATGHLWLRSHVHACTTPSAVVFLDLRRDAYFALALHYGPLLSLLIDGWPQSVQGTAKPDLQEAAARLAELLLKQQLVTKDEASGRRASVAHVAPMTQPSAPKNLFSGRLSGGDLLRILCACLRARLLIASGLERAVSRIASRSSGSKHGPDDEEIERALRATRKFRRLRIWFFKADGHCLFHSLALIEFLALHGLNPRLVLGVRTDHWAAHSWVQLGGFVLDSSPERARFYTPILVA